ncbi:hypothetical protein NLM24_04720 [Nocardia zapadnayensis]|nr:hypothetical protein [Nocardia zapadnayensis]MCX0270022.1 hypothetical protein [Nocardia zapadnayensis]
MQDQTDPDDPELHRQILRRVSEWTAALSKKPAGVPVWQFPLRAFEIAADLADAPTDPAATPMSGELCLEMLTYTPVRIRKRNGAEATTCIAQWASDSGRTVLQVIRDFEHGYCHGELVWEPTDGDGVHMFTTL